MLAAAAKQPECVAIDEAGWRGGQADHARVEILDHFGEALEERTMGLIEDDEVEESRAELRVAQRHRLLGGDEEALGLVDLMRVDPRSRFVRKVGLETVGQGLIDEGITVGEEENVLRLIGPQEHVDQGHRRARLAGAGGHDEECAALVGGEGFGHATNRFVLVRAVDDRAVDGSGFERKSVLPEEVQPLQISGSEEPGDEARDWPGRSPRTRCRGRWP